MLCSDGLSGPVKDAEIGAFAGNFHPKNASRYLTHLANLRGGNDNITVVIARVGAWVEPESATEIPQMQNEADRKGSWMRGITGLLGTKKKATAVKEQIYKACDCPISEELLDHLYDLVKRSQTVAEGQGWPVEIAAVTDQRRIASKLRKQGKLRHALHELGESIEMLGTAGRLHKKALSQS